MRDHTQSKATHSFRVAFDFVLAIKSAILVLLLANRSLPFHFQNDLLKMKSKIRCVIACLLWAALASQVSLYSQQHSAGLQFLYLKHWSGAESLERNWMLFSFKPTQQSMGIAAFGVLERPGHYLRMDVGYGLSRFHYFQDRREEAYASTVDYNQNGKTVFIWLEIGKRFQLGDRLVLFTGVSPGYSLSFGYKLEYSIKKYDDGALQETFRVSQKGRVGHGAPLDAVIRLQYMLTQRIEIGLATRVGFYSYFGTRRSDMVETRTDANGDVFFNEESTLVESGISLNGISMSRPMLSLAYRFGQSN